MGRQHLPRHPQRRRDGLAHVRGGVREQVKCGISHWSPNSAIVHATSTSGPAGPYTRKDVAVVPFAHNPKVVRAPDGTWLMYTIGVQLPASKLFNCSHSQQVEEPPPAPTPGRNPENLESNITLFTSDSLEGPWTRYGTVLGPDYKGMWDEDTSNPSPWVLPNGVNTTACKRLFSLGCVPHTDGAVLQTVFLMYRGCTVFQPGCNGEYMGVASAPTWKGPYTRLLPRPILPKIYAEDPSM